ncbi:MAG: bifunctional metallophosphatase/5'-nucleotidase [Bacteroidales bacterium]
MRLFTFSLLIATLFLVNACKEQPRAVRIAVTTDVHGMIFPTDMVRMEPSDHSLAHIYSYVEKQRAKKDTLFFLLDNGDFLQGQPTVYYYNFIDTSSVHLSARVMNFMGYDAGTVGNHDIEAGPAVYDRIRREVDFPWLAANAINTNTGAPYFTPYTVLKAGRKKIAVLGLITPRIPHWLPRNLWPDMEFRDMTETAAEWIPRIREAEEPDLIVGLFHSGTDSSYGGNVDPYLNENATLLVARNVPGFDLIFAGHDHKVTDQWIMNAAGDSVLVMDPGSHARYAGEVTIEFTPGGDHRLEGRMIPMTDYTASTDFMKHFSSDFDAVTTYLEDTITWLSNEMTGVDALFGPSPMMTLIHRVQLELSGARLSFTAPLSLNARLKKGPLLVSDMFQLYRYENMLYSMTLSGEEIDRYLEYSAGIWFSTMHGPQDPMLLYQEDRPGRLANSYYNFSSAAGIDYIVDLTRPAGDRISVLGFTDGAPFDDDQTYQVAINSYRGNGGGGHLTRGAGIPQQDLESRITWSTDIDLRYYLMQYLSEQDTVRSVTWDNWKIVPESWVKAASARERSNFH